MNILLILLVVILFALTCLPTLAQIYFGGKKLRGQTSSPLYAINLATIALSAATSVGLTFLTLYVILPHYTGRGQATLLVLAGQIYFMIGAMSVLLVQPLLALFFYIKSIKHDGTDGKV